MAQALRRGKIPRNPRMLGSGDVASTPSMVSLVRVPCARFGASRKLGVPRAWVGAGGKAGVLRPYPSPVGLTLLLGQATMDVPPPLLGVVLVRRRRTSCPLMWVGKRTGSQIECPRACGCAALGPLGRTQVVASLPAERLQASRSALGGSCWPRP